MESVMLIPHFGRSSGTDTSRQRQDYARRPSCDTAIEGFDQRARRALRPQPEDGDEVEEARLRPRCPDGAEGTALDGCPFRKLHPSDWRVSANQNMIADDCNFSLAWPPAVRLFQVTAGAGSRDPGAAASAERASSACATSAVHDLGRSRAVRLALSRLALHP